ncbi:M56 family metallopeptidase [Mucilaginibacter antarcticus]|uniref:M56 family metallopeptidase n=1 Tax=Mucilaginibacter antarcticus TaxID=1855725 RepID=UPI0036372565
MATLIFSFAIPLATIPVSHQYVPVLSQVVHVEMQQSQQQRQIQPVQAIQQVAVSQVGTPTVALQQTATVQPISINWPEVFNTLYLLAAAVLFVRLIFIIGKFFWNIKGKECTKLGKIKVIKGDKTVNNGSFLNYIFLNDNALSADEIKQIVEHELLHVRLYHSLDRLLIKVAEVALWFNPFIYLYARSVEENHEFEVDLVMGKSTDKCQYADLLLHLCVAGHGNLYHNFSKVPLKERITMLFTKPTNHMKKIIYLLILPVVMISCLAFAKFKLRQPLAGVLKIDAGALKLANKKLELTLPVLKVGNGNPKEKAVAEENAEAINWQAPQMANQQAILPADTNRKANSPNIDRKIEAMYADAASQFWPGKPNMIFFKKVRLTNADGTTYDRGIFEMINGKAAVNLNLKEKIGVILNDVFYTEEAVNKYAEGKTLMLGINTRKPQIIRKNNVDYFVPFTFFP